MTYNDGSLVRIAVDAMGGDYAPEEIIKGAVMSAKEKTAEIILVGPLDIMERELAKHDVSHLPITCVRTDEVIKEGEHPAFAIRRKPNASIAVATKLIQTGKADALVSAGPTGATSVSAIRFLGMIPGIDRPVVCAPLVGLAPNTVLVDGGANVDCRPNQLLSFAIIGSVYARKLLNVPNPKVALLSVGVEEGKGSKLIQESYSLLQSSNLNFIGNVEGNDVLSGQANVIVCDGTIGNVLMKFYESLGCYVVKWLKGKLNNLPLAGPAKKLLDQMASFTRITGKESDGGGLLWGVNGVIQVMHGNSRAKQLSKAVERTREAVKTDLLGYLKSELVMMGNAQTVKSRSLLDRLEITTQS